MPSEAPSAAPTLTPPLPESPSINGTVQYLEIILGAILLGLTLCWLGKKFVDSACYQDWTVYGSWVPLKKQHTMETEYLNSPEDSPRSLSSKGSYNKYDAV
jgi:hypothetical protein